MEEGAEWRKGLSGGTRDRRGFVRDISNIHFILIFIPPLQHRKIEEEIERKKAELRDTKKLGLNSDEESDVSSECSCTIICSHDFHPLNQPHVT